ncbi:NHL repeat-containing protein 2-like [Haliotis cracherodii]|uniref:NHL repeat-containing protein 2-like n=1 Tax=Haliotis cracherodii TaxID=6455 RepID=UPI0039E9E868
MAGLTEVVAQCMTLEEELTDITDKEERKAIILRHLDKVDSLDFVIPDFKTGLDWLNVPEALSLANQLAGKVLVLDFFTYCCINCMHVLPDLEYLESKFKVKDGVVIVGVHSAKFLNEKVTANILSAVLRYNIEHPVVNDCDALLWQQLEISCWPTFLLVGPKGQYIYAMVGEGHRDKLEEFVGIAVEHYKAKDEVKVADIPLSLEKHKQQGSPLSFPGKLCLTEGGDLVVADTGNNRVLVLQAETGIVQHVVGGPDQGFQDGDFSRARFSSPQGVAAWGTQVYVADTDNHTIRLIDLETGTVRTIAGTGLQGTDKEGGRSGPQQPLSSPWDVVLGWGQGDLSPSVLYIAMAGTHQIWVYFLQDRKWYKGSEHKAGACIRFAGSGNEENRNNSYPAKAAFAQPSGLAASPPDKLNSLYVADAESSSVRTVLLKDGAVRALVGGERDPTNLFAFGDVDGVGVAAKLQHPLGVALVGDEGPLLVVDSYNHKLKSIDLKTKECTTVIGLSEEGRQLSEPGGLCVDARKGVVYVADTNHHAIKVYNMEKKTLTQLPVILDYFPEKSENNDTADPAPDVDSVHTALKVRPGGHLDLTLTVDLAVEDHLNEEAPNSWKLQSQDNLGKLIISNNGASKGKLRPETTQRFTQLQIPTASEESHCDLTFTFQLFVCAADNTCRIVKRVTLLPLTMSQDAAETAAADISLSLRS